MGERNTTDVGLDTFKSSIQVAMLLPGARRRWSGRSPTSREPFGGWRSA